jgi:multidrug efflux pump subunit AcrB
MLRFFLGAVFLAVSGCSLPPPRPLQFITVQAKYEGASAQVVADTVAAPIEQQVNGVEHQRYLHSRCGKDGSYLLTIAIDPDADLDMALVLVQNRVALATPILPDSVQRTGITVLKQAAANAPPVQPITLIIQDRQLHGFDDHSKLAESLVERLRASDKLTAVSVGASGRKQEQLQIDIDLEAAHIAGVAMSDINETLQVYFGSPNEKRPSIGRKERIEVQAREAVRQADEIRELKVRSGAGTMVPLSGLVKVRIVQAPALIERFDQYSIIEITANPADGVSIAEARRFCEDELEKARKDLKLGGGFTAVWMSDQTAGR